MNLLLWKLLTLCKGRQAKTTQITKSGKFILHKCYENTAKVMRAIGIRYDFVIIDL